MRLRRCHPLVLLLAAVAPTWAQPHAHARPPAVEAGAPPPSHAPMTGVLGVPMARDGSGTAWVPDQTPVRGWHLRAGGWQLMLHGNLFVGYDAQGGDTGDDALIAPGWLMAMAAHPLGAGRLELRTMLSPEPWTVGARGYPLLLQTGETYQGEPLVDRQHPHDLLMELAARVDQPLGDTVALQGYLALAGEPALGPVAFPHRFSAMADPLAVIGHHWQDATHISYGVATLGVLTRHAKLEGSWFNGREPDETRWDVDLRGFDSWSGRLSVNPTARLSAQVSYGRLDSPEALEPEVTVERVTASAMHAAQAGNRAWATTLVWGRNLPSEGPATDAAALESALDLGRLGVTMVRAEVATKTGHDLGLEPAMEATTFTVGSLALAQVHPLPSVGSVAPGLGVRGSVALVDDGLEARYGTRAPLGIMAYLQLQPPRMPGHGGH